MELRPVSYTHLDVYKRQGEDTFRKWEPLKNKFTGAFSIAAFEVIVTGLAKNINNYHDTPESIEILQEKIKSVSLNPVFVENSGSGKRASTRLPHFIPVSYTHLDVYKRQVHKLAQVKLS